MSLTFPPVTNQATVSITTANSNALVTLTSPSTITTTAVSSASCMVSINPASAICFAATGQDTNFETRLNHSHKKQIVWKHGPNRPFYALMLRTKLY